MKKKVYKAFNEQVQAELYSAYMYLAMSLDMEAKNFKGMAHWLKAHRLPITALRWNCSKKFWNMKNMLLPAFTICMK